MPVTRRSALALPLVLAGCTSQPVSRTVFLEANDHVVVPVGLGGHETLALLDNGAPLTSLDRAFADQAGLAKAAAGGGLAPLDMRIGGEAIRVHPDLEDMTEAAIAADAPVGAIAGMEIFDAYAVGLAYSRSILTLHRRPFRSAEGSIALDVDRGPPPHPGLDILLNGRHRLRAYVDLGSSAALLVSPRLADSLGLGRDRPVSTRQVIISQADGLGLSVSRLTSIDSLTLADWTLRDVPVDILPADARPFAGIDAAIGQPLLRRFDLVFDLPRRLHLAANGRLADPFERRRTGLQVKPQGEALLVRHVALGSPAELLGFAAGDLITAIDGEKPLMRTLRNAAEGQVLTLSLADGRTRRLTASRYY